MHRGDLHSLLGSCPSQSIQLLLNSLHYDSLFLLWKLLPRLSLLWNQLPRDLQGHHPEQRCASGLSPPLRFWMESLQLPELLLRRLQWRLLWQQLLQAMGLRLWLRLQHLLMGEWRCRPQASRSILYTRTNLKSSNYLPAGEMC